jgi:hypothetical protein
MNDYAYQIQGALENADGNLTGLRVLVCNVNNLEEVDVPIKILDTGTIAYLKFRLSLSEKLLIQKLPIRIQNRIRSPLGRWLDKWVLINFYGDTLERKSINP